MIKKRVFAFMLVITMCLSCLFFYPVKKIVNAAGGQQITGTFTSANTSGGLVTVDCGFEPDYVQVILPFSNGDTYAIYDSEISTTTSTWYIPMESRTYTITLGSSSGETGIQEITSNGFVFRSNAGNTQGKSCTYVASNGVDRYVFIDDVFSSYSSVEDGYFNSETNYNNNYNLVDGTLKYAVVNRFTNNNAYSLYNTYWGTNNILNDLNNYLFKDCKIYLPSKNGYIYNDYSKLYTLFSDFGGRTSICVIYSEDKPFILGNIIYCKSEFTAAVTYYNDVLNDSDQDNQNWFNELSYYKTDYFTSTLDNNLGCHVLSSGYNPNYILASNIPIYFNIDTNYSADALTLANTYNLTDTATYIGYILNNNDTSGFVIDRNVQKLNDNSTNNNNNDIVNHEFDPKLFNGSLGFNSFNASAALNYNSTTEKYEPYFDIKYQPNNYTEINIEDVSIYYQAEVDLKLTFTDDFNSYYSMTTRYKTSGQGSLDRSGTSPNANRYEFILYAMNNPPLGNPSWSNTSLRNTAGLSSHFNVNPFTGYSVDGDITIGVSAYKHNNYVVTDSESNVNELINDIFSGNNGKGNRTYNSYGLYKIQIYIKNNVTGDISNTYTAVFDLYGNKIADNSNSMINNDDNAYNNFVNDFYYVDDNGDLKPIDYADHINVDGSDNNNVINIQNPQYPYLLVDIPENEWINKTPNLKNLLTDFKTMLAETNEGSILTMLPATYNYLPAPVMQYLLYGVGLIVMIGIWRAITRR